MFTAMIPRHGENGNHPHATNDSEPSNNNNNRIDFNNNMTFIDVMMNRLSS